MSAMDKLIAVWPQLIAEERGAIYRADPEALDLCWRASDTKQRKSFCIAWARELKIMIDAGHLKPVPPPVDVAKTAEALRRNAPRDAVAVRGFADSLEHLAPYIPKLPRGVD
jgi:hypothetical protein